jgi:methionine biosynthesis protein MetW
MAKKKYADRFVGITPREYGELEDRHKKVLEIFSKYEFERILDVGCGDGNFSMLIGKACRAKEVYGIEISEKGVEMARKNGVKCYQLDVDEEDFPFEDNFFDAVFAGEIIEHLYDTDHFLNEAYRVLKADGILVLTTPNLASWQNRISLLFGYQPYGTTVSLRYRIGHPFGDSDLLPEDIIQGRKHVSVFAFKALQRLLKVHKFKIVKTEGLSIKLPQYMNFSPFLSKVVRIIDKMLSPFPSLLPQLVVIGAPLK